MSNKDLNSGCSQFDGLYESQDAEASEKAEEAANVGDKIDKEHRGRLDDVSDDEILKKEKQACRALLEHVIGDVLGLE